MIRFCDKEVYAVTEGEMTRTQMLAFFLGGGKQISSDCRLRRRWAV